MRVRRSLPVLATAGLAAALLLSACGSSLPAGANGAPTATTSASPTTSGSPTTGASGTTSVGTPTSPAGGDTTPSGATATGGVALPAVCAPSSMKTKKPGELTVATDQPVYEPWFVDNDPANGKGFESAVAYAVAKKLGYPKDKVTWVRVGFNAAAAPTPKNFDFDINEFSITAERKKAVDFSTGYYDVTQAVVSVKGSKIANAKTLAELKNAKLGAQIGTTSLTVLQQDIKPTQQPAVFQTNVAAVQALQNGQIDGLVTDLPTAFYMSSAQVKGGVLVGQLPDTGSAEEQFGLVLEKGSPITGCVSDAVDTLRADGTLKALEKQWLTAQGAPILK